MAVRLSVVTAVRDGVRALQMALGRWVQDEAVDEVVVVDFGSARPLTELGLLEVAKVVVVRSGAGAPWARGLALNVGVEAARGEAVLALDCGDALLGAGGYEARLRAEGGYWTSYGERMGRPELALLRREDWRGAGGFHEYLLGAGFEDEDLFNRLEDRGLRHRFVAPGDVAREGVSEATAEDGVDGLALPDSLERNRAFQIGRNKILAGLAPWDASMPELRKRRFGRVGERALSCELAERSALERRLHDCASYLAARFLFDAPESVAFPMLKAMIDERHETYEGRAHRQRQIEAVLAARRTPASGFRRTR